uniref:Uncharacterized protein n=1 Tax=Glossina brevipalpis TaxID=37001 RepID=A0A1A9WMN6_9MUSC
MQYEGRDHFKKNTWSIILIAFEMVENKKVTITSTSIWSLILIAFEMLESNKWITITTTTIWSLILIAFEVLEEDHDYFNNNLEDRLDFIFDKCRKLYFLFTKELGRRTWSARTQTQVWKTGSVDGPIVIWSVVTVVDDYVAVVVMTLIVGRQPKSGHILIAVNFDLWVFYLKRRETTPLKRTIKCNRMMNR